MPTTTQPICEGARLAPNQRKLTAADYRRMPEGPPWFELIDGILLQEPSPTSGHQGVVGELHCDLLLWKRKTVAGLVRLAPFDVYLSERDVLQPDLLFVAEKRRSIVREDGVHGPPDLVVEVLSPSNAQITRTRKKAIYAQSGVKEMWLVEPELRLFHIHRFDQNPINPVRTLGPDDFLTSPHLPGFNVAIRELFVP